MSAFSKIIDKKNIIFTKIYSYHESKYYDIVDELKDNINPKHKDFCNKLHQLVDNDCGKIRSYKDNLKNIIEDAYEKENKKKLTDEDEDEDEIKSEGRVNDKLRELRSKINSVEINPSGLCKTALLYVKKAEELNLLDEFKNLNFFYFTYLTGYYAEPFIGVISSGKIFTDLVEKYETYTEYHKETDHILSYIEKWIQTNDEIKQWIKDEELSSIIKMNAVQWTYCIALYYVNVSKTKIKDFKVFFPIDGYSEGPIKSFGYHIIYSTDINKHIDEIQQVYREKAISDKLLDDIIGNEDVSEFQYEEYLYMLSQYFMKDPKSLTNNLVFHFENSEEDYYPFKFNFYSIKYDYIVKFIEHIKKINDKHNFELVELIKNWSLENEIISDKKLNCKAWKKIIKRYFKKNNKKLDKDLIFYVPRQNHYSNRLNYHIINYEDLKDFEDKTDLLDLLDYDSEDDVSVKSDNSSIF